MSCKNIKYTFFTFSIHSNQQAYILLLCEEQGQQIELVPDIPPITDDQCIKSLKAVDGMLFRGVSV